MILIIIVFLVISRTNSSKSFDDFFDVCMLESFYESSLHVHNPHHTHHRVFRPQKQQQHWSKFLKPIQRFSQVFQGSNIHHGTRHSQSAQSFFQSGMSRHEWLWPNSNIWRRYYERGHWTLSADEHERNCPFQRRLPRQLPVEASSCYTFIG